MHVILRKWRFGPKEWYQVLGSLFRSLPSHTHTWNHLPACCQKTSLGYWRPVSLWKKKCSDALWASFLLKHTYSNSNHILEITMKPKHQPFKWTWTVIKKYEIHFFCSKGTYSGSRYSYSWRNNCPLQHHPRGQTVTLPASMSPTRAPGRLIVGSYWHQQCPLWSLIPSGFYGMESPWNSLWGLMINTPKSFGNKLLGDFIK